MTRVHNINNGSFWQWQLAQRRPQRQADPVWVAIALNVAIGLAVWVIWAVVR
jgi:type VI protein secretion system component VasF